MDKDKISGGQNYKNNEKDKKDKKDKNSKMTEFCLCQTKMTK